MRRLVVAIVSTLAPAVSLAQDDACLRVREWFDTSWTLAPSLDISGYEYEITVREPPKYSAGEIAAMERQVDSFPDHPLRQKIRVASEALERGEQVTTYTVYMLTNDRWRINTTYHNEGASIPWHDVVSDTNVMWMLTPSQLAIMSPDHVPSQRDFRSDADRIIDIIRHVHTGGLGVSSAYAMRPVHVEASADGWHVTTEAPGHPLACQYEIVGSPELPRVRSRRVTDIWPESQEYFLGREYTYLDWTHDEQRDVVRATVIEEHTPGGRLDKATSVRTVGPLSQREFDALAAIPNESRGDAIRGAIEDLDTTFDYRRQRIDVTSRDGEVSFYIWGDAVVEDRKLIGWSAIAALTVVLIGARIYRARRA